jgi:hypothetical protein
VQTRENQHLSLTYNMYANALNTTLLTLMLVRMWYEESTYSNTLWAQEEWAWNQVAKHNQGQRKAKGESSPWSLESGACRNNTRRQQRPWRSKRAKKWVKGGPTTPPRTPLLQDHKIPPQDPIDDSCSRPLVYDPKPKSTSEDHNLGKWRRPENYDVGLRKS